MNWIMFQSVVGYYYLFHDGLMLVFNSHLKHVDSLNYHCIKDFINSINKNSGLDYLRYKVVRVDKVPYTIIDKANNYANKLVI